MENLTQRWTQTGHYLQNQGTFFDFQNRAGEASHPRNRTFMRFYGDSGLVQSSFLVLSSMLSNSRMQIWVWKLVNSPSSL